MRRALQFDIRLRVSQSQTARLRLPTASRPCCSVILVQKLACVYACKINAIILSGASDKVFLSIFLSYCKNRCNVRHRHVRLQHSLLHFSRTPTSVLARKRNLHAALCSFETLLSAFVQKMAQLFDRPSDALRRAECRKRARGHQTYFTTSLTILSAREEKLDQLGRNREEGAVSAVHQF